MKTRFYHLYAVLCLCSCKPNADPLTATQPSGTATPTVLSSTPIDAAIALAEKGDALAQYNLGRSYADGEGVPKDAVEAVKWYRKAAEQGDADGQYGVGFAYASGEGVPKDYVEAAKWFHKAAEQGNSYSQVMLGHAYAEGEGVPKDAVEAAKWYRKAAEQGDVNGQYLLGLVYAIGRGVPKDDAVAYKWLLLAAAKGNEDARSTVAKIEKELTPELRAEGQRMAREFEQLEAPK
jgi:uncharacterized protein YdaT